VIVGIDARIPISTGRGWGRYACEIIQALTATQELELRILLPKGSLADRLAAQLRPSRNVQTACVDFAPSSPDHYCLATRGINLETVFGRVDVLHSPTRFILPSNIRPLVATVHDVAPLSEPAFKSEYRHATWRAIEYIRKHDVQLITVSKFTRRELGTRAGLPIDDVVVVHHGVSDVFAPSSKAARAARGEYLLYVGGAGPNKNLERLLAAVRRLRETHRLDLVMAGDHAWDREELRRALGPDAPRWVRPRGYVTEHELADLYRNAAVCLVPSLHEGFGLPVLEAMACGTPVACSRIPVLEEVAEDAAAYFDPWSVEDIALAVGALLDDRDLAAKLVERGRARAQEFTWAKAARETLAVYRQALSGNGLRGA